jgi:LysM repeat protein
MNTPNPLVPEGSQLEQKSKARSRVKLAVFFVLSIHVVGLMALLVQGCRPEEQAAVDQPVAPPEIPVFEPIAIPPADTNGLLPPVGDLPPEEGVAETPYTPPPNVTPPPVHTPAPPVVEPAAVQTYVIKKGDTYYSIGKQFGVSMQAIKDANPGVDPTRLQVGKSINVPPPAPASTPAVTPSASGEIVYTVVSGDTLSKIASKYGTTWQAIKELNNLPTTNIKVGDKLRIPAPKPPAGGPAGGY